MTKRESDIESAFCEPAAAKVGTVTLRPFSLGTLSLCRKLNLTLFLEGDDGLTDDEKQRQIVTFAWMQSQPLQRVLLAIRSGCYEDEVSEFEFGLAVSDLPDLMIEIQRLAEMAAAASVDVEAKPGDKPEANSPK